MKTWSPSERVSSSPAPGGVKYTRTALGKALSQSQTPSAPITIIDIGRAHRGFIDLILDALPPEQRAAVIQGVPVPSESDEADEGLSPESAFLDHLLQQALEHDASDIHWQIRPKNASSFAFRREGQLMHRMETINPFGQTLMTEERMQAMGIGQVAGTIRRCLNGTWHIFRYQCMPCYPSGTDVAFRRA